MHRKMIMPFRTIALAALLGLAAPATAAEVAVEELRARIAEIDPNFQVDAIHATEVDGLFEIVSGARIFYMTGDGRYLIRGQLIDLESDRNLTAERQQTLTHEVVDALGEDSMVVFRPKNGPAEHDITVFTDTTCPYCQQLHRGLLEMIEEYPVKVRYLMFPRAGLQARAADTLRNVWCAPDPQQALTDAKAGQPVPERDASCSTPIAEHFRVARQIGVSGTPYILIDDGPIVPGYRPNDQLLQMMGLAPPAEQ